MIIQIRNITENSNNLFKLAVYSANKKSVDLFKSMFD